MCSDIMTGRGIDQVLPSQSDPRWLERTMDRECASFGGQVTLSEAGRLTLDTVNGAAVAEEEIMTLLSGF